MRIAICDDEEAQRLLIIKYLEEWGRLRRVVVEVVSFPGAESFWFRWQEDRRFDLLVLDIEMGKLSGMELAGQIREEDEELPILFVTGYESYMAQGYEVSAIQYLLKPLNKEKLFAVLDKLQKGKKPETKIPFQIEEGLLFLTPTEVWYVEAMGHYSMLHTSKEEYPLKMSFSEVMKVVQDRKEFVHCHRSFLVNIQHVAAIYKSELILDNKVKIPISRSSYKVVNQVFILNYGLHKTEM